MKDSLLLTPGPRAFQLMVREALCRWGIHDGDRVTIDPDRPPADGALVLAVVDTITPPALPQLLTYHHVGRQEWLHSPTQGVGSDPYPCRGFRVVGTAVLHQSKGEPIYRSNIAWIDGAPPELGIPAPDQPL